jgi:hypothetical protein
MRIFVPTRARIYKQKTRKSFYLDRISDETDYRVTYVVPQAEFDLYTRNWPKGEVIAVPDEFRLSDIRQWLVDSFYYDPYHCCFDDDLVFLRRVAPENIKQRSDTTFEDAKACFERIESYLKDGYAHGALSQRAGNNNHVPVKKLVGRATDTHFYNAAILKGEGIRINALTLRQDFHTTLSLLELGYPNVLDHEFMSGQKDGEPGGCQVYRTLKMLSEQADVLAKLHPGFVAVVEKERKTGFGTSTDVRISWVKAFNSRREERKLP